MDAIYDLKDMLCEELEQVMASGNVNLDMIDRINTYFKIC